MFYGCSALKELNLSNFNTNNVTNMEYMFSDCSSLKELDISNFEFDSFVHDFYLFYDCPKNMKIKEKQ